MYFQPFKCWDYFCPKHKDATIFENRLNPVMLVLILFFSKLANSLLSNSWHQHWWKWQLWTQFTIDHSFNEQAKKSGSVNEYIQNNIYWTLYFPLKLEIRFYPKYSLKIKDSWESCDIVFCANHHILWLIHIHTC